MTDKHQTMKKSSFSLRSLRISLKYRPDLLKRILKMRACIKRKNSLLLRLKHQLKELENKLLNKDLTIDKENHTNVDAKAKSNEISSEQSENTKLTADLKEPINNDDGFQKEPKTRDTSTQTETNFTTEAESNAKENEDKPKEDSGWKLNEDNDTKSIAEQVKEAAQDAMKEFGMVYVESAGMYYDYKTGYYYNSELGLYYHTDTGCYYNYSEKKKSFVFHSYPKTDAADAALIVHERKKAKKHKMDKKAEEAIDNLTKNLSQDGQEDETNGKKPKRKKSKKEDEKENSPKENKDEVSEPSAEAEVNEKKPSDSEPKDGKTEDSPEEKQEPQELEDGECSDTTVEDSASDDDEVQSNASSTASDDSVARHHPPCMRVIVRETNLPKLRVGSLFIVTKDGGTVGREGDKHTILLSDSNVSRNHLDIRYDEKRNSYVAMDLGSRNGSILNGNRMSKSQVISDPMEIVHGSTLQLGETKLLCHIHRGNDTCGHCEPGLIMEAQEKEKKVAYTRTCSVKKQHELELARLKNKYGPKPMLAIEETAYNDRAQARRETVGSSHHSEKTQTSDISTSIAADNKGFKLLEKMGWNKGEGLGKDSQGNIEPVPLVSNEGKTGLGAVPTPHNPANTLGPATLRLASRTRMLKPPAKAFQNTFDEDSE
ncbi:uncharacterized protein LOC142979728 isoform X1 [Anticarsia gemmatalis]|uniref:uncharacterized protein LOC142979728 isoform X1 n=1 Tax=Anticarsia gemmatalis TaxID=129554 RepID=UPI003F77062C